MVPVSLRRLFLLSLTTILLATSVIVAPAAMAQVPDVTPPNVDDPGTTVPDDTFDRILFDIIDEESGLASVTFGLLQNVTVSIEPYTPGTTEPVAVELDVVNSSAPVAFAVAMRDVAGNDLTWYVYVDLRTPTVRVYVNTTSAFLGADLPYEIQNLPINGPASTRASVQRTLMTATQLAILLHDNGQDQLACLQLSNLELQLRAQIAKRRIAARDAESALLYLGLSRVGLSCPGMMTF